MHGDTLDKKSLLAPKGKNAIRRKRQLISDADGWTHVTSRLSSLGKCEGSICRQPPVSPEMTVEDIDREHQQYARHWQRSDACVELKVRLTCVDEGNYGVAAGNHRRDGKNVSISNIVCLGLGSLQGLSLQLRQTSHTQLAALETIKSTLGLSSLRVIIQDPIFTAFDKEFLGSMGYTVTDDPDAFGHISVGSLVFALHCSSSLYRKISEGPHPAMLVGNDIQKIVLKEPQLQGVLESMFQQCDEISFPQLRTYFNDTVIYWRRSVGKRPEEEKI